jgi:hypothetical protein
MHGGELALAAGISIGNIWRATWETGSVLLGLLALAEYGNYVNGSKLARLCELTDRAGIVALPPQTKAQEIAAICSKPESE